MDEEDEHFLSESHQKCILLSGTECHIINYLLTELARAVPGNIGPRLFLYRPRCARSVLSQPRANIPQYGPHARLVRGYYVITELSLANMSSQIFPSQNLKFAGTYLWACILKQTTEHLLSLTQ